LFRSCIIRYIPNAPTGPILRRFLAEIREQRSFDAAWLRPGTGVVTRLAGVHVIQIISSQWFWDKKVKIAILALATFIAMC